MHVEHWQPVARDGVDTLTRAFTFADWTASLAFVDRIVAIARAQDHDPLIEISGGQVTIHVWSHDVAGISDRDERFATAVNALS